MLNMVLVQKRYVTCWRDQIAGSALRNLPKKSAFRVFGQLVFILNLPRAAAFRIAKVILNLRMAGPKIFRRPRHVSI
jgi:hypothetical protein